MDYKEKYEMALEGIQEILGSGEDSIKMSRLQLRLQGIFPELKESEDDKIRKDMISYIKRITKTSNISLDQIKECNAWIDWLEKQGEHAKFRDSIQVGDKVTRNQDGMLVNLSQLNRVAKKNEKQGEQKPINIVTMLDDYFANTPKEQQDKDWEELKHLNNFGWELVKQKPAEWSEEDIMRIDNLIAIIENKGYPDYVRWLEYLKNKISLHLNQNWTEEDKPYFKKISLILSKELQADEFHDVMTWFEHLKGTNEEPNILKDAIPYNNEDGLIDDTIKAKSEQKSTEWSEEDEKYILNIIHFLEHPTLLGKSNKHIAIEMIDWLKSLRPQNRWKPSIAQLNALSIVSKGCAPDDIEEIKSLYADLKKLMEE